MHFTRGTPTVRRRRLRVRHVLDYLPSRHLFSTRTCWRATVGARTCVWRLQPATAHADLAEDLDVEEDHDDAGRPEGEERGPDGEVGVEEAAFVVGASVGVVHS